MEIPTPQIESRWSAPHLVERSRVLRGTLLARGEPAAALDRYAPGGADNTTEDPLGARIVEYALLRARYAVLEWQGTQDAARGRAALDAALASAPERVTFADGTVRAVAPKSYHALRWCDALDAALQPVRARIERADPDQMEATTLAPLTESLAVRLWVWILTHPAPGLPFSESGPADPPEWTTTLTPADVLAVWAAHHRVNRERIALLVTLFPQDPADDETRLSLSGFLGTVAQELHQRPSEVLRHWSLGEAFAQAVVAAQSAREARARAERDRA